MYGRPVSTSRRTTCEFIVTRSGGTANGSKSLGAADAHLKVALNLGFKLVSYESGLEQKALRVRNSDAEWSGRRRDFTRVTVNSADCSVRHLNSSLDQPQSQRRARLGQPPVQVSHSLAHSLQVFRVCLEVL